MGAAAPAKGMVPVSAAVVVVVVAVSVVAVVVCLMHRCV
jgi:hypothetical protein